MPETFAVGTVVGSISKTSVNRRLALALEKLGPEVGLELREIPIEPLPFYNRDYEEEGASYPAAATEFRERIAAADGILFVTTEYNRSVPGVLKNAIDWVSRPKTDAPMGGKPSYVVGTSRGSIGTALAQQHLRSPLFFLASPQLAQPEVFLRYADGLINDEGEITNEATRDFLRSALQAFHAHLVLHVGHREA